MAALKQMRHRNRRCIVQVGIGARRTGGAVGTMLLMIMHRVGSNPACASA
jgi:hypothetical protein